MKSWKLVLMILAVALVAALSFVHFGLFNVAADEPHSRPVLWLAETVREASIAVRAKGIEVPDLEDPDQLLAGGADYNEMCTGCHLKPGRKESEMTAGLYPPPPNLTLPPGQRVIPELARDLKRLAAREFWVIKHGMKMTGMPAWGPTHDDQRIWAMVAFLQKLPGLTPEQYQVLTARSEGESGHEHGAGEAMDMDMSSGNSEPAGHSHDEAAGSMVDMPGMVSSTETTKSPQATVDAFHDALKTGDVARATALLDPAMVVYEGGGAERSRADYVKAHMPDDMAFMKTAEVKVLNTKADQVGDAGWVISESRIRGNDSRGKPFDVLSTETAVLRRAEGGWRIAHIHWSSQRYEPKDAHQH